MKDQEAFERAFIAVTYLLGRRSELARGLGGHAGARARELESEFSTNEQAERAKILARELLPVATALDSRRIR
jgi:hypothetical protein